MSDDEETDITEKFFANCKAIDPGELCHVQNFDLHDVMTAIELMDPKMDARMQIPRKVRYLKETLKKELLPFDENIPPKVLLGIIDETLACFVNWLKGDTLGQTVFINMYMHCTERIENKALGGFCEAMKNIILFIKDVISKGCVAEEEDFYLSTSRMPLDDNVDDSVIIGILKEADEGFSDVLQTTSEEDQEIVAGLQDRIRFVRNLLLWTVVIKKYLQDPTSTDSSKEVAHRESAKYLGNLTTLIANMRNTSSLGEPAGQGKHDPSQLPYGLLGFEPFLNQPLLPPAIPRCANIEDRSSAFTFLEQTIARLTSISQILTFDVSLNIATEWGFIQYFGRFGCEAASSQSCVLSRSLLLIFYMSFFSQQRRSEQPSSAENSFDPSKIVALKSSLRHFLRLTAWSDLESLIDLDDKLTLFLGACTENLFQIPITYCLNRSRQRNRLELVIDAHWDLYDECVKVDQIVRSFLCAQNNSLNSKRHRNMPPIFSSFVAVFQFRTMVDYLVSGFELELYAPQELVAVYFVLGDNVFRYFVAHCREVETSQQREQAKVPKIANKKSRKIIDREITANLASIRGEIMRLSVLYDLTMGFFYLMCALTRDGKLAAMGDRCGTYSTPEMCYLRRFSAIIGRGWFGDSGSFGKFSARVASLATKSVAEVYGMAAACFDSSRKAVEGCPPLLFRDTSDRQLKAIAKNNMVVSRLLASGSTKMVLMNFEESKERAFPLIKIK